MENKKIYTIYCVEELKIVSTWDICKKLTHGIKGKSFKSFKNDEKIEIALWFLNKIIKESQTIRDLREKDLIKLLNISSNDLETLYLKIENNFEKKDNKELQNYLDEISKKSHIAFVDGSYKDSTKEYSYALCVVNKDKIVFENAKKYKDNNNMRQINGEIKAALFACNYALENNIKDIYIAYDYAGIEKFATMEWETKKEHIQYYIDTMQRFMKVINIHFIKIPAHENFKYNEYADLLAKKVLGIKK